MVQNYFVAIIICSNYYLVKFLDTLTNPFFLRTFSTRN